MLQIFLLLCFKHSDSGQHQCGQIVRFIALWASFQKPEAIIILPKPPIFLFNFSKGVKIYHFSSEIIFGQPLLRHLAIFFWSHWSSHAMRAKTLPRSWSSRWRRTISKNPLFVMAGLGRLVRVGKLLRLGVGGR